jgi:hypothetical protein
LCEEWRQQPTRASDEGERQVLLLTAGGYDGGGGQGLLQQRAQWQLHPPSCNRAGGRGTDRGTDRGA